MTTLPGRNRVSKRIRTSGLRGVFTKLEYLILNQKAVLRPNAYGAKRVDRRLRVAELGEDLPRHEVAGSWCAGWQRVLWGLCVGAELDGGRDASTTPPACLHVPGGRPRIVLLYNFKWSPLS